MASLSIGRLPKTHIVRDFLDRDTHARILAESIENEAAYGPSRVSRYDGGKLVDCVLNPKSRVANSRKLSTGLAEQFTRAIFERRDEIAKATHTAYPAKPAIEIEAVHSGDGAFFKTHIDTIQGKASVHRVISAVYYFSRQPKGFMGGELRIWSLDRTSSVTIEPEDNAIIFFSSIVPHEVLPVSVPSGAFEDGRFSINCWINRAS